MLPGVVVLVRRVFLRAERLGRLQLRRRPACVDGVEEVAAAACPEEAKPRQRTQHRSTRHPRVRLHVALFPEPERQKIPRSAWHDAIKLDHDASTLSPRPAHGAPCRCWNALAGSDARRPRSRSPRRWMSTDATHAHVGGSAAAQPAAHRGREQVGRDVHGEMRWRSAPGCAGHGARPRQTRCEGGRCRSGCAVRGVAGRKRPDVTEPNHQGLLGDVVRRPRP